MAQAQQTNFSVQLGLQHLAELGQASFKREGSRNSEADHCHMDLPLTVFFKQKSNILGQVFFPDGSDKGRGEDEGWVGLHRSDHDPAASVHSLAFKDKL